MKNFPHLPLAAPRSPIDLRLFLLLPHQRTTGIYTRAPTARAPPKLGKGLTGTMHPANLKPPWNPNEGRILDYVRTPMHPQLQDQLFPDGDGATLSDLSVLDAEGRVLCPNQHPLSTA